MRKGVLLGFLTVVVIASLAGVALAQESTVRGSPTLDVHLPENTVMPGTSDQLSIQIANTGDIAGGAANAELVTTARNVRVEIVDHDAPFTVETGQQAIGSVGTDAPGEATVRVDVPADAEPGEYEMEVRMRYAHTSLYAPGSGITQDVTRSRTRTVDVVVDDSPRFGFEVLDTDAQVGDAGSVAIEVTNRGGSPAYDLDVHVGSLTPNVLIGDGAGETARLDRLEENESAMLEYDVSLPPDVTARNFSMEGQVFYADEDGIRAADANRTFGIGPVAEQAFSLEVDQSTLRVGETGTISGEIRNDGPTAVDGVALVFEDGAFEPRSPSYSIGSLEPGESAPFQFRALVPETTDPTPQRIDVTTRYRTQADSERTSEHSMHVSVEERRDAVAVTGVDPRFAAGADGVLELEVTNQRDDTVRDVRLTLGVGDPLESDFRESVIASLEPGESEHVAFDLEVDSDAPPSTYPATVEVNYTGPDDETESVRPATVPVTVTDAEATEIPSIEVFIFVVLLLLVAGVFVWLYRQ